MFHIFRTTEHPKGNVFIPPLFDWVQRNVDLNLHKVLEYYRNRVLYLPNNHILNRVIGVGMVPLDYENMRFLEAAHARGPYIGKALGFTSSIDAGFLQGGSLYGPNSQQYIMGLNSYISPFEDRKTLIARSAVTAITHNANSFDFSLPQATTYPDLSGLAVVGVDIPLLLTQYRAFALSIYNNPGEDKNASPMRFVTTRVLPSILRSHLEWCWINRLMSVFYGEPIQNNVNTLTLSVQDYSNELTDVAKIVLNKIEGTSMQYIHMLQNIPSFFHQSTLSFLQVPETALTYHVWWLLLLSRFKVMQFLVDVGGKKGMRVNGGYINQLRTELSRLLRGNIPNKVEKDDALMQFKIDAQSFLRRQ